MIKINDILDRFYYLFYIIKYNMFNTHFLIKKVSKNAGNKGFLEKIWCYKNMIAKKVIMCYNFYKENINL